jgi:hypothetical protein
LSNVITTLWQTAKALNAEVTGISWSGFNLVGDAASISEVKRLMWIEACYVAYKRRVEEDKADDEANTIRLTLE